MSFSGDPYDGDDRLDEWTRQPGVTWAAAAIFVVVVGVVAVTSVLLALSDKERVRDDASDVPAERETSAEAVGPAAGTELLPYIDTRRRALSTASGEQTAVVSFGRYMTESEARSLVSQSTVVSLLAAIPGGRPALLEGSVATWVADQQKSIREERDEMQKLIPSSANDPEFKAFYERCVKVFTRALEQTRADSPLVFATVVRGPAAALQAIGTNLEVRLVDLAPQPASEELDYGGVRPEEAVIAGDPPERPSDQAESDAECFASPVPSGG